MYIKELRGKLPSRTAVKRFDLFSCVNTTESTNVLGALLGHIQDTKISQKLLKCLNIQIIFKFRNIRARNDQDIIYSVCFLLLRLKQVNILVYSKTSK